MGFFRQLHHRRNSKRAGLPVHLSSDGNVAVRRIKVVVVTIAVWNLIGSMLSGIGFLLGGGADLIQGDSRRLVKTMRLWMLVATAC